MTNHTSHLKKEWLFSLSLNDTTANIIREDHDCVQDEETEIIKTTIKLVQNNIALVSMDSATYPSVHSIADLDTQLSLIPESLQPPASSKD